jgi:hypothetical protein
VRLLSRSVRLILWISIGVLWIGALSAQPTLTGTIEGRVFDAGRGEYLENALVSVEGTALETLTDATGAYRLSAVPAGNARLKVFYLQRIVRNRTLSNDEPAICLINPVPVHH